MEQVKDEVQSVSDSIVEVPVTIAEPVKVVKRSAKKSAQTNSKAPNSREDSDMVRLCLSITIGATQDNIGPILSKLETIARRLGFTPDRFDRVLSLDPTVLNDASTLVFEYIRGSNVIMGLGHSVNNGIPAVLVTLARMLKDGK